VFYLNRSSRIAGVMSLLMVWAWGEAAMAQDAPQARIASTIKNEERVVLKGTTPPLLAKSVDKGRMPGGQNLGRMILQLSPSEEQEQAAEKLVGELHDASSPQFHKWLTPAEYGQQFGVASEDASKVAQ
jgi:subtilase family serine protease